MGSILPSGRVNREDTIGKHGEQFFKEESGKRRKIKRFSLPSNGKMYLKMQDTDCEIKDSSSMKLKGSTATARTGF